MRPRWRSSGDGRPTCTREAAAQRRTAVAELLGSRGRRGTRRGRRSAKPLQGRGRPGARSAITRGRRGCSGHSRTGETGADRISPARHAHHGLSAAPSPSPRPLPMPWASDHPRMRAADAKWWMRAVQAQIQGALCREVRSGRDAGICRRQSRPKDRSCRQEYIQGRLSSPTDSAGSEPPSTASRPGSRKGDIK